MARYVPRFVTQDDGSVCAFEHCWAATGAWVADGVSGGHRSPEPVRFCHYARRDPCDNGGFGDIMRGLMNMGLWTVRTRYRSDVPKEELRRILMARSGKLVILAVDLDSWPEARGDAYHSVGVICGGGTGHLKGQVRTMDPIEHHYNFRDVDGVIAAAMEYGREHHDVPGTLDFIIATPPLEKR